MLRKAHSWWKEHGPRVLASTQKVLEIVEKGLDGLPVYGPKAAVGGMITVLQAVRVCSFLLTSDRLSLRSEKRRERGDGRRDGRETGGLHERSFSILSSPDGRISFRIGVCGHRQTGGRLQRVCCDARVRGITY
jgi:hypothetical protein